MTGSTRLEPTDSLSWCLPRSGRHPNVTSCRSVCIHDVSVPARGHLGGVEGSFCLLLPGQMPVAADRPLTVGLMAADCHLFDAQGRAFARRIDITAIEAA